MGSYVPHGAEMSGEQRPEQKMPYDVRETLFKVRCRAKRGDPLSREDTALIEECFEKWPDDYEAMSREVFEATAPFGSRL